MNFAGDIRNDPLSPLSLGTDVLAQILGYFSMPELMRLFMTSRRLHWLFAQVLRFNSSCYSNILPSSVEEATLKSMKRLQTVDLTLSKSEDLYLQSPLQLLPPTLVSLTVSCPYDFEGHAQLGVTSPGAVSLDLASPDSYLPFRQLFPLLHTLVLDECYAGVGLLKTLPDSVTKLELPRALIHDPADLKYLPPLLQHLDMPFLNKSCTVYELPATLEYLKAAEPISTRRASSRSVALASTPLSPLKFVGPANLKELHLNYWSVELISPVFWLGECMTTFHDRCRHTDYLCRIIDSSKLIFPAQLTDLSLPGMDWESTWTDLRELRFPSLQKLHIWSYPVQFQLPSSLTLLNCQQIKKHLHQKLRQLPTELTTLVVLDLGPLASLDDLYFPPNLTTISIKVKSAYPFPLLSKIDIIPPKVKRLMLNGVRLPLSPTLLALLPPALELLAVYSLDFVDVIDKIDPSVRHLAYSWLPPTLKHLETMVLTDDGRTTPDLITSLPPNLTALKLIAAEIPTHMLSLLPPHLTLLADGCMPQNLRREHIAAAHPPLRPCLLEWLSLKERLEATLPLID